MRVFSFWRCAAARVCDFPSKAERTQMNDYVVITYSGQQVSVPKEVADFLEQDRKREQAREKQDERHLSKSEFETVLSGAECVRRPVEDAALWNLQLECLRKAVDGLGTQSRDLV